MKFTKISAIACSAVAALSLGTGAVAATSWDLPLAWPDGNFHVENAKRFASEVNRVTGGEVTVNIHPGGSLGFKGPEMLTSVRDGLIPIGDTLLNQQVGEAPLLGLEAVPYMASGYADLRRLHEYWRPHVEQLIESKYNQKMLYMVPWPRQYVYTKVKATGLDDLKGIKIRTYNKTTTEMFNRIGMTAVQLPWGEVVPSLAAGTIDAVTTSASSGVDGKFWEFLKFTYPTSHVWSSNMVSVNLDAWNALSEAHRKAIETLARQLEPEFWAVSEAEDSKKLKTLNDNGIVTGEVTPAMLEGMREATSDMLGEAVKSIGSPADEIVKAYSSR